MVLFFGRGLLNARNQNKTHRSSIWEQQKNNRLLKLIVYFSLPRAFLSVLEKNKHVRPRWKKQTCVRISRDEGNEMLSAAVRVWSISARPCVCVWSMRKTAPHPAVSQVTLRSGAGLQCTFSYYGYKWWYCSFKKQSRFMCILCEHNIY